MKKILLLTVLVIMFASTCFAVDLENVTNSKPYKEKITLLSAKTATGAGTAEPMKVPLSDFTCHVTWGGTAPTNTVVTLEGSIDNTTYATLSTMTITASGTMWHIANKPVNYIRGNYVSKSGGDGTTAVTLICIAGGN